LARIERREARIRRIQTRLSGQHEAVDSTLLQHHHIGKSENMHQHIGTFLRNNAGDPAIKVCRCPTFGSLTMLISQSIGLLVQVATASPPSFVGNLANPAKSQ